MTRSVVLAVALAAFGLAAAPDPAALIKTRHDGMKQIGGAFKEIGKQAKSGSPDAAVVKTQSATLKKLALAQLNWFPKGSGPESGQKTHTKAAAWSDAAGFKAAQQTFAAEATKLDVIAMKGDMKALPAAVQAVGGTCKGCHDKYREKDD